MSDALEFDESFLKLEQEFKFLRHARRAKEREGNPLWDLPTIIFDVETTGLDPARHEIIELGAFKVAQGAVQDQFHALIRAEQPLPEVITKITGITDETLKDALPIAAVLPDFLAFLGDRLLVAHNIDFDFPFLNFQVNRLFKKGVENEKECTLQLSRALLPHIANHKLHTVAASLHVPLSERHRALGDAETTVGVWHALLKLLEKRGIATRADLKAYFLRQAEQNQLAPF